MRKFLSFFGLVLLSLQSCAQPTQQELQIVQWNTPYFDITYSQHLEQPMMVIYGVACTDGKASRKGLNFRTEDGIHTSDNADYVNNVWDKGHMAPAASFNCDDNMLWETFTYVNCALQHEKLNRGVWKKLEERERDLTDFFGQSARVFIEVDFGSHIERVPGGAAIPIGFYKEIVISDFRECYWFSNTEPVSSELTDYQCNCRD